MDPSPANAAPQDPRRSAVALLIAVTFACGTAAPLWSDTVPLIVPLVWHPVATPMWFFALYALLATTLNASLGWLRGRPVLAAVLGAIGGPLAYYAGARIGAITLTGESLAVLGILWAGLMPGMIWTSRRIN